MCKTLPKQIQIVTFKAPNDQFLGVITNSSSCNLWNVTVLLNGKAVEFKLDTGADVSIIPAKFFKTLKFDTLHPTELISQVLAVIHQKYVGSLKPIYSTKLEAPSKQSTLFLL